MQNIKFKIFTNGYKNTKIAKGMGEVFTIILHLAPANNSGHEVCPFGSPGCRASCLYSAGRGACETVKRARLRRTRRWFEEREGFKSDVIEDIRKLVRLCDDTLRPAVRLNGTSDIAWEREWPELFDMFPQVQFYDYTKDPTRLAYSHYLPTNYHLTFSRSEDNEDIALQILEAGRANVAVVFDEMPEYWHGYRVYNADKDDLRFLDGCQGAVAGLKAKGKARRDRSGFVAA
jgi:hypothetical protein